MHLSGRAVAIFVEIAIKYIKGTLYRDINSNLFKKQIPGLFSYHPYLSY